ncbi:MAG: DUF4058 family protein [Gemmataceae bacterium]|nr:DUF4058 family protein [Gemmataceae bacterium]
MPSPFPGMNPYLERAAVWPSFHLNFLSAALRQLVARLRPEYVVTVGTRMDIHEPPAEDRRLVGLADVGVYNPPGASAPAPGGVATAAPVYVNLPAGAHVERARFLEVRDREGFGLLTVFELLSPSIKYAGDDHEQYLGKRIEVIRSQTHLVELDLLRGGGRMPMDRPVECDYCAVVSRAGERPRAGVWPWRLRELCPPVPIPLREPDPDIDLDVKAVIDEVYDGGGYGRYIYRGPPEPRLSPDDAAWAAQYVPQPGSGG